MQLNTGAYYDHDDYGRVQVVGIDEATDPPAVAFQSTTEVVSAGSGRIPKGWRESRRAFSDRAEPADLTVGLSTETMAADEPLL